MPSWLLFQIASRTSCHRNWRDSPKSLVIGKFLRRRTAGRLPALILSQSTSLGELLHVTKYLRKKRAAGLDRLSPRGIVRLSLDGASGSRRYIVTA
jgi:hypothetical protein